MPQRLPGYGQEASVVHPGYPHHDPAGRDAAGVDPILVSIGDIGVTPNWVITPNGTRPIGSVQWIFSDNTRTTERMPAYAIVLAVIFFLFCLLGLLFLLIKERRTEGYVNVTVQGAGLYHVAQIPVSSPQQIAHLHNVVGYARTVTAHAGGR